MYRALPERKTRLQGDESPTRYEKADVRTQLQFTVPAMRFHERATGVPS